MIQSTASFDLTASVFERHRALPAGVPEAIRESIFENSSKSFKTRILDLGAGTGRIGKTFVEANDCYLGVDLSFPMLTEFSRHSRSATLMQADGSRLPFPDHVFDLVLLMHVLSGIEKWRNLLCETVRVIKPGGFVVVGHTSSSMAGVDARMKRQLNHILQRRGVSSGNPKKSREEPLEWLHTGASRRIQVTAASWTAQRTPREFLDRHRSGARFSSLPASVREESLKELTAWAEKTFGSIDHAFAEEFSFVLHIFRIGIE